MSVPINIVKKTQDSLGKHVKKPPLTEKLLNKPPFRFLHDIISAVIRDSGILTGLYDISEMKSENVKGMYIDFRYYYTLVIIFRQITTFIIVCVAYVFGLQTL